MTATPLAARLLSAASSGSWPGVAAPVPNDLRTHAKAGHDAAGAEANIGNNIPVRGTVSEAQKRKP
jgi:hypothetical protein